MKNYDVNYQLIKSSKLVLSEVIEISQNETSKKILSQLAYKGINELQKQSGHGRWRTLTKCHKETRNKRHCKITKNKFDNSVLITIKKQINTPIRIISYKPQFKSFRKLGSTNGRVHQIVKLPFNNIIKSSLKIQIRRSIDGRFFYEDWIMVDNFKHSTKNDRHFIYNKKINSIVFGDNHFGKIPEESFAPNIFLISCEIFSKKHFLMNKDRNETMEIVKVRKVKENTNNKLTKVNEKKKPFVLNNKAILGVNTYVLKPRITVIEKAEIKGSYVLTKEESKSRLGYTSRIDKNARLK